AFGPWPDVAQLIASDFADLGLTTDVQVRERTAHFTMRDANELIMEIWNEDTSGFPFTGNPKIDPRSDPATIFAVESRTWYATDPRPSRHGCGPRVLPPATSRQRRGPTTPPAILRYAGAPEGQVQSGYAWSA